MPRNASGTYTLPTGNPVVSGTLIEADWANTTLNDLANEITDSLSRSGEGGMLAPFRLADGLQASPGIAWLNEPSTGFYREGSGEMWGVVGGAQILQYTATGVLVPTGKTLTANGGITATTLTTSGAATLASASVTGNLSVGGTLTLTGGLTLNGNVTVGDSSADTLTINSTITSNLIFTDNTYDIGASGATRPRNLYLAGDGVIGGTLGVSGVLTASGGVTGNLTGNVTGNVTGSISGGTVAGTTGTFSSNFTVGGTLGVTGATTLSSTLGVTGAITASGGVSGNVTGNLTGNVTGSISGGTVAGSTGSFSSNVTVGGTLGVTGVATLTANPVLSAGTANGVLYLNGSKEATSGSAITYDGTTFKADSAAVFNDSGADVDFRVESDTNDHALFVQGSDGNVGIGTSSPSSLLHLSSTSPTIQFSETDAGTENYVQASGGAFNFFADDNDAVASTTMGFFVDGTRRATIDSSGNLGLGTTGYGNYYSSDKSISIGVATNIRGQASGTDPYTSIYTNAFINSNAVAEYIVSDFASFYEQYNGAHAWGTAGSGSAGGAITFTQAMTLDASARLKIGTTTAGVGDDNNTALSIANGGATVYTSQKASGGQEFIIGTDATNGTFIGSYSNDNLIFRTNNTERARITSGGELLVGTTSNSNTDRVCVEHTIGINSGSGAIPQINFNSSASTVEFVNRNSGGAKEFRWYYQASAAGSPATLSSSGVWTNASDSRGKENIADITYGLTTVLALQPRQYDVKSDGSHAIGFVAQEVKPIIPELVHVTKRSEDEEFYGLDYGSMTAVLVKAIQEQQAMIEDLKAKVAALEAK